MKCEICGNDIRGKPYKALVDGVELIVCSRCASRLKGPKWEMSVRKVAASRTQRPRRPPPRKLVEYEVVEDFPERVREAREAMGLTRELLARLVGEKESTIRRIESGTLIPSLDLARKLEKALKIVLVVESPLYGYREGGKKGHYELTLGDIVKIRKRKTNR